VRRFYEGIAAAEAARGGLQIALLYDRDRPIAFEFNIVLEQRIFNLKLGYRQDARRFSPGIVLRRHVLGHAIASGATEFDFLGAQERHKLHWTSDARALGEIIVYGRGWRAAGAHMAEHRFRPWLKQSLPWISGLRQRIHHLE
jgi:CelD/BcsL family acetyltransferase involved in cellulose biosynthesis